MTNNLINIDLDYHFNPFGGLNDEEIVEVIVPRIDLDFVVEKIQSGEPRIFEFVGPKGRGKTLHLRYLKLLFPESSIFLLDKNPDFNSIINSQSNLIFIDSIHHLSFRQRNALFKAKKIIVLTAHISRKWEYKIAGKSHLKFKFRGIDNELLKQIIRNRIQLSTNHIEDEIIVNESEVDRLIKIYGDDYRGILNHLYNIFQPKTQHGSSL